MGPFSRERRAAGQVTWSRFSPRPIVLCYFLQNMELEKLMFGKFRGDGLERLSVPHRSKWFLEQSIYHILMNSCKSFFMLIILLDVVPQGRRQGAGRGLAPYGPQISIGNLNFD